jgi:cysteine desulfurase
VIYLDHNSTTPILPEVADAMAAALRAGYANPASQHAFGRRARRALEEAREGIAEVLGAKTTGMDADQLIFTSGGTEANNLALFGLAGETPRRIAISAIEHPSVIGPAEALARRGWQVDRLRVTRDGVIDLVHASELLALRPALISAMLANNETGVLQPIAELAKLCAEQKIQLHTDAVQVAGKLPLHFRDLGVTALTITPHKFHGPRGIGALVVRHGVKLNPLLHGGFQQAGLRPGTEDVALAIGMFTALQLWQREAAERATRMQQLRDRLEVQLFAGDANVVINGAAAQRLPHTSNIAFVGLNRQALLMALDLAGVACSTGSACASGSSEPSPVLLAMGCDEGVVEGSLRLSLGATTTPADVEEAARRILLAVNELRRR